MTPTAVDPTLDLANRPLPSLPFPQSVCSTPASSPQERAEYGQRLSENNPHVHLERGGGNHRQRLHGRQAGDLVPQAVQQDREADGQLRLQVVAQLTDQLTHAADGTLLHLLVDVGRPQLGQRDCVDLGRVWCEVELGGGV